MTNPLTRAFYKIEAARENWAARELERHMGSLLFERLAKNRDKDKVMALARAGQQVDTPADVLKDPRVRAFLDLKEQPAWKERDLEQAITIIRPPAGGERCYHQGAPRSAASAALRCGFPGRRRAGRIQHQPPWKPRTPFCFRSTTGTVDDPLCASLGHGRTASRSILAPTFPRATATHGKDRPACVATAIRLKFSGTSLFGSIGG